MFSLAIKAWRLQPCPCVLYGRVERASVSTVRGEKCPWHAGRLIPPGCDDAKALSRGSLVVHLELYRADFFFIHEQHMDLCNDARLCGRTTGGCLSPPLTSALMMDITSKL